MADVIVNIKAEDNFSGVLGNFGNIITGIKSAVDLLGDAFRTVNDIVAPFINSAADSELTIAKLDAVIRATGGAAGVSSEQLQQYADGLQQVTRFGDEQILSATTILLTFRNINDEVLMRSIPLMLDLAEIFGSEEAAAMQLGKALNDPLNGLGALTRAGVTFSDSQKEQIKNFVETNQLAEAQALILREVELQVGGTAIAVGQTFTGQLAIAKNMLDEVRETIGNALLPILTNLLTTFSEFARRPEVVAFFESLADSISRFLANADLEGRLSGFLDTLMGAMQTGNWAPVWESIQQAFADGWNVVAPAVDGFFARVFAALESKVIEWMDSGGADRLTNQIADSLNVTIASPQFQSKATQAAASLINVLMTAIASVDWFAAFAPLDTALNNWGMGVFESVKDFFVQQLPDAILFGLTSGIMNGFGDVAVALGALVTRIINTVKSLLGISSPSTVFMQIGKDIVQGLIDGLVSMFPTLSGIASTMFGFLTGGSGRTGGATGDATGLLGGGTGSVGGRDMSGTTSGGALATMGQTVNQYFYGPIYVGSWGEITDYDCPTPNPMMGTTGGRLMTTAPR